MTVDNAYRLARRAERQTHRTFRRNTTTRGSADPSNTAGRSPDAGRRVPNNPPANRTSRPQIAEVQKDKGLLGS